MERCFSISLHVPTLKETSLDRDQYLLRLAQTIRMDLASSLGMDVSEAGSLEYWLERGISGWQSLLDDDDDDEDCAGNEIDSTEFQQGTGNSAEVTSGKYSIAYIKFNNMLISRAECQNTSDRTAEQTSTIRLYTESLHNIDQDAQSSNTDNPRKRCPGQHTHHLDLHEDSLNTKSHEGCITEEEPSTGLWGRCSKRQ